MKSTFIQQGTKQRARAPKRDIRNLPMDLHEMVTEVIQDVAFELQKQLRETTPVDTGWARANWSISVGGYKTGAFGDKPKKGTKNFPLSGSDAASIASMETYTVESGTVWVTNNVNYIQIINARGGKIAPAMFVETSMDRACREVAESRKG